MNKKELINSVHIKADLPVAQASAAVDALLQTIEEALTSGEAVRLAGFGTFELKQKSRRCYRNPRTGETLEKKNGLTPAFRASRQLKAKADRDS